MSVTGINDQGLTQAENVKNSKHMGFLKANNITRGCSLNYVHKAGGGGVVSPNVYFTK